MRIFAVIAVVAFLGVLLRGYKVVVPSVSSFFVDPALTQENAAQTTVQSSGKSLAQAIAQNLAQNQNLPQNRQQMLAQNFDQGAGQMLAQNLGQGAGQTIAQSTTPSLSPIAPSENLDGGQVGDNFGLSNSDPQAMQGSMQRMLMEEDVSQTISPDGSTGGSGFEQSVNTQAASQEGGETRERLQELSGSRQRERVLTNELSERRRLLDLREEEIIKKEALLGAAEKQLMIRQKALEEVRDEINERVQNFDTQQQEALSNIMLTYNVMKPRAAAAIFDGLDMDILISVVQNMSARKLAPIMAEMQPDKAQKLTEALSRGELLKQQEEAQRRRR